MSELTQDLIQHALDQDYNKANNTFGEIMTVKMSDLLDQEKIKLAGQIYNGEEPDEEDDQLKSREKLYEAYCAKMHDGVSRFDELMHSTNE